MSLWELTACIAGHNAANRPPGQTTARAPTPEEHRARMERLKDR